MKSEYGRVESRFNDVDKFPARPMVSVAGRIESAGCFFLYSRLRCSAIDGERSFFGHRPETRTNAKLSSGDGKNVGKSEK